MRASPSMEAMTVFPQFKEYGNVLVLQQTNRPQTGRHGMHLATAAHTSAFVGLIVFAITTAFIGSVLLFHAIGLPEGRQRAIAGGAGFTHIGVAVCSLVGAGAVCIKSYRQEKEQAEQQALITQPLPLQASDLALMY